MFYKNQFSGFSNSMKKCRKVSRNLSLAYVYTEESAKRIALDNQKKKGKKGQIDSENSQKESFTDIRPENTGAEGSIDQEDIQQNEASVEEQLSEESSEQTEDEDTVKQEPDNMSDDTIQS